MNSGGASGKIYIIANVLAVVVILLGLVVVYGWLADIPVLRQIHPTFVSMKFNTALLFSLTGIATFYLIRENFNITITIGIFSTLLALATALQYLTGLNFGIDTLVVDDPALIKTVSPGRMGMSSAIGFAVTSIAQILLSARRYRKHAQLVGGLLGGIALALGLSALCGYALDLDAALGWGKFSAMALHTATGFSLLGSVLIIIYWQGQTDKGAEHNQLNPMIIPVAAILLVLNVSISFALNEQEEKLVNGLLASQLDALVDKGSSEIQSHIDALRRMSERWRVRGGMPYTEWIIDAEGYKYSLPGVRATAWVDKEFSVQWVAPLAGNNARVGIDMASEEPLSSALQVSQQQKIAGGLLSRRVQGEAYFLFYAPIFIEGKFDGFILSVVDAHEVKGHTTSQSLGLCDHRVCLLLASNA